MVVAMQRPMIHSTEDTWTMMMARVVAHHHCTWTMEEDVNKDNTMEQVEIRRH